MRLYLVVRGDLKPGYRVPQLCHAQRLFAEEHSEIESEWYRESNTVVCLQVDGVEDIMRLSADAVIAGIAHSVFREPDLSDEPTAVALAPGDESKRLCSQLRLCRAP